MENAQQEEKHIPSHASNKFLRKETNAINHEYKGRQ